MISAVPVECRRTLRDYDRGRWIVQTSRDRYLVDLDRRSIVRLSADGARPAEGLAALSSLEDVEVGFPGRWATFPLGTNQPVVPHVSRIVRTIYTLSRFDVAFLIDSAAAPPPPRPTEAEVHLIAGTDLALAEWIRASEDGDEYVEMQRSLAFIREQTHRWLTVSEVADKLLVARSAVKSMLATRQLLGTRVNGRNRINAWQIIRMRGSETSLWVPLPRLDSVVAAVPDNVELGMLDIFMLTPSDALSLGNTHVSPHLWLRTGRSDLPVVAALRDRVRALYERRS